MNANDFIFNQVYKTLIKEGVKEREAHNAAVIAIDDYKKGKFKTPALLIDSAIKAAKKLSS